MQFAIKKLTDALKQARVSRIRSYLHLVSRTDVTFTVLIVFNAFLDSRVPSKIVILRNNDIRWAINPIFQIEGLSKLYPKFFLSWERRRKISLEGDYKIFSEILTSISSWSTALATIEDFFILIKK